MRPLSSSDRFPSSSPPFRMSADSNGRLLCPVGVGRTHRCPVVAVSCKWSILTFFQNLHGCSHHQVPWLVIEPILHIVRIDIFVITAVPNGSLNHLAERTPLPHEPHLPALFQLLDLSRSWLLFVAFCCTAHLEPCRCGGGVGRCVSQTLTRVCTLISPLCCIGLPVPLGELCESFR
jgi:hypothetical protein